MGTRRRRVGAVWLLFSALMAFELCASLNPEGAALLRLKEAIHADPYGALLDWDEGSMSPCSWFGVDCSADGRVVVLNLANLGLKGVVPPEIGQLMHMKSLILHNNSFYGVIPAEIGYLHDLKVLDLRYNNFSGPIPSELRNIVSPKFPLLNGNKFSETLPVGLHELIRICESQNQDINWSNKVPTSRNVWTATIRRMLATKQKVSKKINFGIPIPPHAPHPLPYRSVSPPPNHPPPPIPLPPSPVSPPPASPAVAQIPSEEKKNRFSAIYASIGAVIGFVVVALSAVCFFYYCHKKSSTIVPLSSSTSCRELQTNSMEGITLFKRCELEEACEGFVNIIDILHEFTLFKGTLPGGAEIAVLSTTILSARDWPTVAEVHYRNKVEVLSKLNHKNLMNLVGYCEDEEPFTRMMVFEYVSNGTLFEHLHYKEAEHLNWQSRLRIVMGVLYCLNYMHEQNTHITPRNLNSLCIYLTEDNAAKVSDINFSDGKKEEEDEFGARHGYITVYKFALLLLETISGRRPYTENGDHFLMWAQRYLTDGNPVMGIVDPTLNSVNEEQVRELSELIRLGFSTDLRQRPTMAEVTRKMQDITGITEDQAAPRNGALWWAELEIITS